MDEAKIFKIPSTQSLEVLLRSWARPVVHPVLYSAQYGRSLGFLIQSLSLPVLEKLLLGSKTNFEDPEYRKNLPEILRSLGELLKKDAQRFEDGTYPLSALVEQNYPWRLDTWVKVLIDGYRLGLRRKNRMHRDFAEDLQSLVGEAPEYYRRNFHFQTDGYFSRHSAEIYDYQVEILFAGGADPMRRLILAPLAHFYRQWKSIKSERRQHGRLRVLELGCGTGSLTKFLVKLLPDAKFTCIDLSDAYLWKARQKLADFTSIDFLQANASDLPFETGFFDVVVSCFLFHELPEPVRVKVIQESKRVLQPGGFMGIVDSLQLGDQPKLDFALERFPLSFHEPFYKNYIQTPLEKQIATEGFLNLVSETGFLSKVISSQASSTSV